MTVTESDLLKLGFIPYGYDYSRGEKTWSLHRDDEHVATVKTTNGVGELTVDVEPDVLGERLRTWAEKEANEFYARRKT